MSMAQDTVRSRLDLSGLFGEWRRREPILAVFALLMAVAMAPTLVAMTIDTRTFNGINVWMKPFKFELSTAVQMATLVWFWAYMDGGIRAWRSVRGFAWAIGLITLFEVGYIAYRASLAQASHFNNSTLVAEIAYALMGLGIISVVAMSAWIGVLVLRSSEGGISPTLRLAIGAGLVVGNILGAITGAYMSQQTGHWVGGVATDTGGIPLFGWSRTGGDLRVAHFIGLHAMQGIPVIGYFVRNLPAGRTIVWGSLAIWTATTIFFFAQAIGARPFLPL